MGKIKPAATAGKGERKVMSADNWTTCPKCCADIEQAHAAAIAKAEKAYGKVPVDEYLALRDEANQPPKFEDTLREDYELGVYAGKFSVSYACSCQKCGWKFSFEQEKVLPL